MNKWNYLCLLGLISFLQACDISKDFPAQKIDYSVDTNPSVKTQAQIKTSKEPSFDPHNSVSKPPVERLSPIEAEAKTLTRYGIDISHYQGNLMRELGRANKLTFVICKATQGKYYVDPDFHKNWSTINQHGLIRGAYHFYVAEDDPIEQAKHYAYHIQDIDQNDIPPIVDIEQLSMPSKKRISPRELQEQLKIFLDEIENIFDRKPIIYTSYAYAQEFLNNPYFAKYDLWLAEYSGSKQPSVPDTWKDKGWKIWQRADTHHVDSVETDFDIYIGYAKDLVKD